MNANVYAHDVCVCEITSIKFKKKAHLIYAQGISKFKAHKNI
ncbi:hypothetical protein GCM10010392_68900 [Streptomyces clavifer]|nr:hypothetical protein GCM10010392_68900 [Streptomyces clavifer]